MAFACEGFAEGVVGGGVGWGGEGNTADEERPSRDGLKLSLGLTGV